MEPGNGNRRAPAFYSEKLQEASCILGEELFVSRDVLDLYADDELSKPVELRLSGRLATATVSLLPLDDVQEQDVEKALAIGSVLNNLYSCVECKEVLLPASIGGHACGEVPAEWKVYSRDLKRPQRPQKERPCGPAGKGAARDPSAQGDYLDTHCGVADQEVGVSCNRSLNCKSHSILLKRAVSGRSAPLDVLLKRNSEEKKRKKLARLQGASGGKAPKRAKKQEAPAEQHADSEESEEVERDEYRQLEASVVSSIVHHAPVIDKSFYLPEIKFDTLAIRSIFFQPLKVQRIQSLEKKARMPRRDPGTPEPLEERSFN